MGEDEIFGNVVTSENTKNRNKALEAHDIRDANESSAVGNSYTTCDSGVNFIGGKKSFNQDFLFFHATVEGK